MVDNEVELGLELSAAGDGWVGIGLSRDRNMGDDDIFYCQRRGRDVGVVSAFSTGMSRPVNVAGQAHVTSIGTDNSSGRFRCSFRRPISVDKGGLTYDLAQGEWFILLSFGGVTDGEANYHGSSAAGVAISTPTAVRFSVDFPNQFFSGTSSVSSGIRAHAALMFTAWGFLVPAG